MWDQPKPPSPAIFGPSTQVRVPTPVSVRNPIVSLSPFPVCISVCQVRGSGLICFHSSLHWGRWCLHSSSKCLGVCLQWPQVHLGESIEEDGIAFFSLAEKPLFSGFPSSFTIK